MPRGSSRCSMSMTARPSTLRRTFPSTALIGRSVRLSGRPAPARRPSAGAVRRRGALRRRRLANRRAHHRRDRAGRRLRRRDGARSPPSGSAAVPAWLRPYPVLSTGENFRADLARIICERRRASSSTSSPASSTARLRRSARSRSRRRGGGTRGQAVAALLPLRHHRVAPARLGLRHGTESSPGGVFGDAHGSSSRSRRRTGVTGRCLSRITI